MLGRKVKRQHYKMASNKIWREHLPGPVILASWSLTSSLGNCESLNVSYWSCDICVYAMVDCIDKFIHIVTKHNLNIKRYSLYILPYLWKALCLMFIKQPFLNIILNIPISPSKSLCLFYKQERKSKPSKDIYEK